MVEEIVLNLWWIIKLIYSNLFFLNLIFAVVIVFFQRREPKSVWAWLLVLYFIPILGFIFYLCLGTDFHKRKMFREKEMEDKLNEVIRRQELTIQSKEMEATRPQIIGYADVVMYNLTTTGAILTEDNSLDIITEGNEKFDKLIADLKKAKHFIHIQYYIIKNDLVFQRIVRVLKEKVEEGVEVRILYDGMGSRTMKKKAWKQLQEAGIKTAEFFPALLGKVHLRINYRNHRKLVIIDNKVGYIGGFNIGKEYIGLDEKFGYWRDTHLRIMGEAVLGLEQRFLLDWNYASKENLLVEEKYMKGLPFVSQEPCQIQVVYSGPDCNLPNIRNNYIRLIHKARKSIYIQSPYFVPDEALLSALHIAIGAGVEVCIMIPCKPDHAFVYWATYSYIGELVQAGAKCYTYDRGFLHAKGMVVDDKVFCYGTANMDIRSFAINFEVSVVVYSREKARDMREKFENDLQYCTLITKEKYGKRNVVIRMKEQVSRLLSPLL